MTVYQADVTFEWEERPGVEGQAAVDALMSFINFVLREAEVPGYSVSATLSAWGEA